MKRVLILDTEATGLDPKVDAVIEVACILYSIEHATVIESYSSLIRATDNAAEAINRIPPAALVGAEHPDAVWARVMVLTDTADAIVAHNAEFDRGFVRDRLRDALPWVCSRSDLTWPKQTKPGPSLVSLALEHDLGVATAHRALADCDLIARLFTRAAELGADLRAMLARGMRPKAEFIALVSFDDKDKAKAAGFQWDAQRKQWKRRMAVEDAAALPFRTQQVQA